MERREVSRESKTDSFSFDFKVSSRTFLTLPSFEKHFPKQNQNNVKWHPVKIVLELQTETFGMSIVKKLFVNSFFLALVTTDLH